MDNQSSKPIQNIIFKNSNELYRCYMPFIKGGGLFLSFNKDITPNNIEPQETIIAKITLPGLTEPINIKGEVVWINLATMNKGYGISISNLDESTIKIKDLIENIIKDPTLKSEKKHTF